MDNLTSGAATNWEFGDKELEQAAVSLKTDVMELIRKAKIAFKKSNSTLIRDMKVSSRAVLLGIAKMNKFARTKLPTSGSTTSTSTTQTTPRYQTQQQSQVAPIPLKSALKPKLSPSPSPSPVQQIDPIPQPVVAKKSRTTESIEADLVKGGRTKTTEPVEADNFSMGGRARSHTLSGRARSHTISEREEVLATTKKSITQAKANMEALVKKSQEEKNEENNRVLQTVLKQIMMMEEKMKKMEQKLEEDKEKETNGEDLVASPVAVAESEAMMKMILALQEKVADSTSVVDMSDREKRLTEMEEKMKAREELMMRKEKEMEERFEKMLDRLDLKELNKKLEKLDKLDKINFDGGMMMMGSGKGYDELKKEIEELYKVIFDDNTSDKDKAAANISLEKAMKEIEKTSEFLEEKRRVEDEWRKTNEPLNEKAYTEMVAMLKSEANSNAEAFKQRVKKSPELLLILLNKDTILKRHESDFKTYALAITEREMRALRHNMPKFRPDQKTQMAFVESIENKIRECSKALPPPPPVKRSNKAWKAPKPSGDGSISFLDELKQKRAQKD